MFTAGDNTLPRVLLRPPWSPSNLCPLHYGLELAFQNCRSALPPLWCVQALVLPAAAGRAGSLRSQPLLHPRTLTSARLAPTLLSRPAVYLPGLLPGTRLNPILLISKMRRAACEVSLTSVTWEVFLGEKRLSRSEAAEGGGGKVRR